MRALWKSRKEEKIEKKNEKREKKKEKLKEKREMRNELFFFSHCNFSIRFGCISQNDLINLVKPTKLVSNQIYILALEFHLNFHENSEVPENFGKKRIHRDFVIPNFKIKNEKNGKNEKKMNRNSIQYYYY